MRQENIGPCACCGGSGNPFPGPPYPAASGDYICWTTLNECSEDIGVHIPKFPCVEGADPPGYFCNYCFVFPSFGVGTWATEDPADGYPCQFATGTHWQMDCCTIIVPNGYTTTGEYDWNGSPCCCQTASGYMPGADWPTWSGMGFDAPCYDPDSPIASMCGTCDPEPGFSLVISFDTHPTSPYYAEYFCAAADFCAAGCVTFDLVDEQNIPTDINGNLLAAPATIAVCPCAPDGIGFGFGDTQ